MFFISSFFSVLFSTVVETAAALQALCPGLWLSHFLWRKKKKKENAGAEVSLKKERFFRTLIFMIWSVAALNVILVKQDYQNYFAKISRQEKCWFYYGQLSTQRPQKVYTFMRHYAVSIKKCTPL